MSISARASINDLRNTPLEEVLLHLGATPDPKDPKNWKTARGRITVTGPKFYNHDEGIGGGGAIDLVMHLERVGFLDALHRLGGVLPFTRPADPSTASVAPLRPKNLPPVPIEEHWSVVRGYLTGIRGIGWDFVERLHGEGWIYADTYKNAVFLNERKTGAELRGTGPLPFHGYRGEKSPFRLDGPEEEIAFVESAIDALSLRQIGFSGIILSFGGGAKGLIQSCGSDAGKKGLKVWGAFDNDRAGETFFETLKEAVPGAGRLRPMGKDWNEELLLRNAG